MKKDDSSSEKDKDLKKQESTYSSSYRPDTSSNRGATSFSSSNRANDYCYSPWSSGCYYKANSTSSSSVPYWERSDTSSLSSSSTIYASLTQLKKEKESQKEKEKEKTTGCFSCIKPKKK